MKLFFKMLILSLLVGGIYIVAQDVPPVTSVDTEIADAKAMAGAFQTIIAGVKAGGVGYIFANILVILSLIIGFARITSKISIWTLQLVMKFTNAKIDENINRFIMPVPLKVLEFTAGLAGLISLSGWKRLTPKKT